MATLWQRLTARWRKEESNYVANEATLSEGEPRIGHEQLEDYQSGEFVDEHLGGIDPERLLEDDRPSSREAE
jgi:hypothetical protein